MISIRNFQTNKLDKLPRGVPGEAGHAKAKESVEYGALAESFPWNDFGMGTYASDQKTSDDNEQSVPEVDPGKYDVFMSFSFNV